MSHGTVASSTRSAAGQRRPAMYAPRMLEQAIPVLRTRNAERAVAWYARMGFTKEWEHRFEPELPAFVSIVREPLRLFLSEHAGDAPGPALVYLRLEDVQSIAKAYGASIDHQPWGSDEVMLEDPDGNRVRVGWPSGRSPDPESAEEP